MKFTKMHLQGKLNDQAAERYARLIGWSYLIAATGVAAAAIIAAVRWW